MAIVTISRGSASGGLLLAEGLAEKLGYKIVSREDIVHEAARFNVPEEKLQAALVKAPGFWDRFRHERRQYLAFVQTALCEHAQKDRIIYHGNAGHLLLRGVSHVVCIRLIAPMSFRVSMVVERRNLSPEEAVRYIEKVDKQRKSWTRFLYGEDWLDPGLYDLVINLQTLEVDGAVDIAAAAVGRKEFAITEESRKAMADLVLASKIRAALAANAETASAEVEVDVKEGVATLKGRIQSVSMIDPIIQVAAGVEGVLRVDRDNLDSSNFIV
jgi:cytidylate kinase